MPDTITPYDVAPSLANWTRRVAGMYVKDLKALSPDAYLSSSGGVARSAKEFTLEVISFNYFGAMLLNGEAPPNPTDEEKAAFAASLDSIENACNAVTASAEALADAMQANGHRFAERVTAPWGEEMDVYTLANLCANHIMYHDGQLNIVQSLHGDAAMHWSDA